MEEDISTNNGVNIVKEVLEEKKKKSDRIKDSNPCGSLALQFA